LPADVSTSFKYIFGHFDRPGADVMITIFCDFSQSSAKKLAFFLNSNVMINFFSEFSFVLSQKRQFFRENILKIGPCVPKYIPLLVLRFL
jgi:hypothetical protein